MNPQTEKLGVMVCGHGSRDEHAVAEFARLASGLKARLPQHPVEYGYLEFATPIIRTGLDALREAGANRILAVPGMLFAAGHAKNDIPSVLNTYAAAHDGVSIDYGRELGIDTRMVRAAGARIQEALDAAGDGVPVHETLLVVVGRGASDPDANSNVAKIMRLLWEGFGFGWGETAYSGVTFPLVEPALERAARLGFRRIIVFPYFLFTGVLVKRIFEHTDRVAARFPDIEFVKAPYLSDHPLVVETFVSRIEEILTGANLMNCALCKYREQVLGFEDEVGLPQASHHHHVEGAGTGPAHHHHHDHHHDSGTGGQSNAETGADQRQTSQQYAPSRARSSGETYPRHDHGADHAHDHGPDHGHGHHHHHPYPHADHPLGPKSMKGKG